MLSAQFKQLALVPQKSHEIITMEEREDHEAIKSFQASREVNFSSELVTTVAGDSQTTTFSLCAEWAFERVFIEIFLGVILLVNLFSAYIVLSSSVPKTSSKFMSNCIKFINISNCLMLLHLLVYPFAFSWTHLMTSTEEEDAVDINSNISANVLRQPWSSVEHYGDEDIHPCQQTERVTCKISGFLFGLFLYIPLASLAVMTVDTTLCAFRWKMHRFRPHTVSTLRLTLLWGFLFATVTSFGLPSFEIGTHYHYNQFYKICWISVDKKDFAVQEFAYFIFGFGCFLLLLIVLFGYMILQAYRAEKLALNEMIGHQCTLLIGHYTIVKSRAWVSYARLMLWLNGVAILSYLPATVGYLVRYAFPLSGMRWFSIVIESSVLLFPTVSPFLFIGLCKPYLHRATYIFRVCFGRPNAIKQMSPLLRSESAWSERSGAFTDVDTFGYKNMYLKKEPPKKSNQKDNYGFQRQHFDRLREVYPSQYAFSQISNSPYNPIYNDAPEPERGQFDQNTPTLPRDRLDILPRRLGDSNKAQVQRQRRFYAQEPTLKRENLMSKLVRPAISRGKMHPRMKRQSSQFEMPPVMPQFGLFHDEKSNQVAMSRPAPTKWKISDSFYSKEVHGKIDSKQNRFSPKHFGSDRVQASSFYQSQSPWNQFLNRTSTLETIDSDTEQNIIPNQGYLDHTIQSSNYSFDMNDQDGTYGRAFQPNFSYRFKRYRGK